MNAALWTTMFRTLLSMAGAALVSQGYFDNQTMASIVESCSTLLGAALIVGPIAWSVWKRWNSKRWKELFGSMIRYALGIGGMSAIVAALNTDQATFMALLTNLKVILGALAMVIPPIWACFTKRSK